jgi:sarcosine oxidase subunit beta
LTVSDGSGVTTADVVVVGAGVVGMFVAWNLAQRGAAVEVIERVGLGSGATAVQPGGIRTQWTSPDTCAMALESRAFYDQIDDLLRPRQSPEFDPCGYVFAASTPETLAGLADGVRRQNQLGVASEMLTASDLADLVPGIDGSQILGGSYNATDGYFSRPGAVVTAVADAARTLGVTVTIAEVDALERDGDLWVVRAGARTVRARQVVVAAGAASAGVVASTDIALPLRAEPRYLFYSNPVKRWLVRPLVVFQDEHFAVKHLADGSVLASDLSFGLDGTVDEPGWRRRLTETARRLVPLLEHVRYPVMVTGHYDVTPDAQLIVGEVTERPGLFVACGMNGRGLMLAPSVGRMVAEAVTSPGSAPIPAGLLPQRFSGDEPLVGERQVI